MENEHAVTASNLFKISGFHGVLLFKHHDPLAFSEAQLLSLLASHFCFVFPPKLTRHTTSPRPGSTLTPAPSF